MLMAEPRPSAVLIVAPPGYGKTQLLADWAAHEQRDVAWLTLDDFDNEPSVFLSYVAAAIDRIEPIDPTIGAALAAPGTGILGAAVPRLASELHRRSRPGVLILDDLHRLVDRTCLDALTALLEHLPPGFQIAMAARTSPDLALGRLRAHRDLLEIGRGQLACDAAETEALAAATGHRLSGDQARALAERTEGWAAAIYLAALGLGRGEPGAVVEDGGSGRDGYIADYIRSELRSSLDDLDVTLLTRTSILDVVEPGLADAVAGLSDGPERLRKLARTNLLIDELAGAQASYRCHNLLRDYLRAELDRHEPGSAALLHRRAVSWYSAAGRPELAIEHSIASGDLDATARLVEGAFLASYYGGHSDRLDRWLEAFDDAAFERRPSLAVDAGWMHALNGRPQAADRMADIVERSRFSGSPADGSASFESARAMLRAVMARSGPGDMLADATFAVAAEGSGSSWRSLALMLLAKANEMRNDVAAADALLAEAVDAAPVDGRYVFYALAMRARLAMARGEWNAAAQYARESHGSFERTNLGSVATALLVHAVAARVAIHHGNVALGRDELVHAQLVRPHASYALPSVAVGALMELARAYLAIADHAGARSVVSEAEQISHLRPDLGVLSEQLGEIRRRLDVTTRTFPGPSTLTPAELRVLPMLSTHLMFEEIGDRLHVSRHTVKAHVVSIYGKLGVSSRGAAVDRAIEIGLLEPFPGLRLGARPSGAE
jgi:LuxR family maltose regulon positive regulatory protein